MLAGCLAGSKFGQPDRQHQARRASLAGSRRLSQAVKQQGRSDWAGAWVQACCKARQHGQPAAGHTPAQEGVRAWSQAGSSQPASGGGTRRPACCLLSQPASTHWLPCTCCLLTSREECLQPPCPLQQPWHQHLPLAPPCRPSKQPPLPPLGD